MKPGFRLLRSEVEMPMKDPSSPLPDFPPRDRDFQNCYKRAKTGPIREDLVLRPSFYRNYFSLLPPIGGGGSNFPFFLWETRNFLAATNQRYFFGFLYLVQNGFLPIQNPYCPQKKKGKWPIFLIGGNKENISGKNWT